MPAFLPTYSEEPFYMNEFQAQFETRSKLGDDEWFKNAPVIEQRYACKTSEAPFWVHPLRRMPLTAEEEEAMERITDKGVVPVVDGLHRTVLEESSSKEDMHRLANEADLAARMHWKMELARESKLAIELQTTHNTLKKLKVKFNRDKDVADRQSIDFLALEYNHHKRRMQEMKDEWFAYKKDMAAGIEARLCDETKRMAADKERAFQLMAIICRTFIIRDTCEHVMPLCSDATVDEVVRRSSAKDMCRLVLIQHGLVVTNALLRRLRETRESLWPMIVGKACYELACGRAIQRVEQLFIDALLANARHIAGIKREEAEKRLREKKAEEEQKKRWREERRLTRSHKKIKRDGPGDSPATPGLATTLMPFAPTRAGLAEARRTGGGCP